MDHDAWTFEHLFFFVACFVFIIRLDFSLPRSACAVCTDTVVDRDIFRLLFLVLFFTFPSLLLHLLHRRRTLLGGREKKKHA